MGRKSNWKSSDTTPIRVPTALVDRLLEVARAMDAGEVQDFVQKRQIGETHPTRLISVDGTGYLLKGGYFSGDVLETCDRLCDALLDRCEELGIDPRLVYARLVEVWLEPVEQ